MHRLLPILSLAAAPLVACNPCIVPASVDSGSVIAKANGARWQSDAGTWWLDDVSGLSIDAETTNGWSLSIVAQTTEDGLSASEAIDAEEFPIEFTISEGSAGGWAIVEPPEGGSETTADAAEAGWLTIADRESDDLLGCFEFEAGIGETAIEMSSGTFRVFPQT